MRKKTFKKIFLWGVFTFLFLTSVLAVHIYIVTRPKVPDEHTIIMARIDIKQDINKEDAVKITNWLYQQKGVDHAMANADSKIAVFTFHPINNNANEIVRSLKSDLNYNVERFLPTADQMKSGCPVASTSTSYKVYSYIKNMF